MISNWLSKNTANAGALARLDARKQAAERDAQIVYERHQQAEDLKRAADAQAKEKLRAHYDPTYVMGSEQSDLLQEPTPRHTTARDEAEASEASSSFRPPLSPQATPQASQSEAAGAGDDDGPPTKKKKLYSGGRRNRTDETWHRRAACCFMCLHPSIWGKLDRKEAFAKATAMIGYARTAPYNWFAIPRPGKAIKKETCKLKNWWQLCYDMTWKDVKYEFQEVDELLSYDEVVADDSDVREELKEYAEFKGDKTVLSKYDKTCSSSEKGKLARNSESVVVQKVGSKRSAQSKARKVCYPTAEAFLVKTLRERWQQGDPISRMELRDELATVFTEDTSGDSLAFYKQMIDLEKANQCSNLSRWMSMAFSRMVPPYSEREKTVSQSVPTNWYEIAINSCGPGGSIFETFDEAFDGHGPDVIVAADQSFFLFHHEAKRVMVPMGSKRVGGNVKADAKVRYSHVCLCVCMSNKHRLIFSFGRPDAP